MNNPFYSIFLLTLLFSNNTIEKEIAPTFYLKTLEGKNFFLSKSIEKGNPIVLSFFATWCVPCKKELPKLDSLSKVFNDVSFYLVNVSGLAGKEKEEKEKVKKMLLSLNINLSVLMDKYAVTAKKYDALVMPTTVIINPDGLIDYKHSGYEKGDENKFTKILKLYSKI